jgi:hypothetical protein
MGHDTLLIFAWLWLGMLMWWVWLKGRRALEAKREGSGYSSPVMVDGNQSCDLGHAAYNILFYIGLVAMAQLQ